MKDAPRLYGFIACKPSESCRWGGAAGRLAGGLVRGGLLALGSARGQSSFHVSWVALSAVEQLR